jgi:hypothetical protein
MFFMPQAATKRTAEGSANGSPKSKARPPTPPPQQSASASSSTGSRVMGVSVDPQNKYIEAIADAKKLSLDPALRQNEEHLKSQRTPVLRELLKLEGINHIYRGTSKLGVDNHNVSKPELINAIMTHYTKGKGSQRP